MRRVTYNYLYNHLIKCMGTLKEKPRQHNLKIKLKANDDLNEYDIIYNVVV